MLSSFNIDTKSFDTCPMFERLNGVGPLSISSNMLDTDIDKIRKDCLVILQQGMPNGNIKAYR